MGIIYCEKDRTFTLQTKETTYQMQVDQYGFLLHLYYGKKAEGCMDYLLTYYDRGFSGNPYDAGTDRTYSMDSLPQELSCYGNGDFRSASLMLENGDGSMSCDMRYKNYTIRDGKYSLPGLPAVYADNDEAQTLEIVLEDPATGVEAMLLYGVLPELDIITRSVYIRNQSSEKFYVNKVMSAELDFLYGDYDLLTFYGRHAMERNLQRVPVAHGSQMIGSVRGTSSHQYNPMMILAEKDTTEDHGGCYAMSFVYSGNFRMQAEVDTHDVTRITAGINPEGFDWKLEPGESFQTPEAVLVYSENGLNGMSQTFQKLYAKRLARGYWRDKARPILNNNWEATYFDFTEDRLVEIARKAKECGVELFVLDDGWFGARRNDRAGLGDWVANEELLPNGIKGLSERIEALGLKFGLWFEPEMVNKDSDLYRAHPDWILQTPGRNTSHGRYQYVLDFARKEVVDHIYGMMAKLLSESKISYIKWDMNRSITECYSSKLPSDRQGEVFHRYILGVYDLYERLTNEFPEVLFESCASGGGRFDPGMLYYAPQGWTSDDSDAIERLKIQYGTSMCYPLSSMGSHVSVVPNHQVFRNTPLHTRANVAYFGTFGYELDLNKLTEEEIKEVKEQITFMKEYREVLQFGTFYRLKSPFEGNETVWMVTNEDRTLAIVGYYRVLNGVNQPYSRVRLQGLNPDMVYENVWNHTENYGDELMNYGLITSDVTAGEVPGNVTPCTDFESRIYMLKGKKVQEGR